VGGNRRARSFGHVGGQLGRDVDVRGRGCDLEHVPSAGPLHGQVGHLARLLFAAYALLEQRVRVRAAPLLLGDGASELREPVRDSFLISITVAAHSLQCPLDFFLSKMPLAHQGLLHRTVVRLPRQRFAADEILELINVRLTSAGLLREFIVQRSLKRIESLLNRAVVRVAERRFA
jgi:hypothetical protein